jgi:hypothetical protein
VDCENARLLLLFYRPGRTADLAAEDVAALESHLAGCPDCAARLARGRAADAKLGPAVRAVGVPADLRAGLVEAATARAAAAGRRAILRRVLQAAAVATTLAVAWSGYAAATREPLDAESLVYQNDVLIEGGGEPVRAWLDDARLPPLPEEFNLQLVRRHGDLRLQNRTVPGLLLESADGHLAWVYYLPPGAFDLRTAGNAQSSNTAARLYRDLPGGWAVLVVYTGNDLRRFLRPETGKA